MSMIGRNSKPGVSIGQMKYDTPRCLGTSGSVRAMRMPNLLRCAPDDQIFEPFTMYRSPSRTARVARFARSEPLSGSENSWHHTSSPVRIGHR